MLLLTTAVGDGNMAVVPGPPGIWYLLSAVITALLWQWLALALLTLQWIDITVDSCTLRCSAAACAVAFGSVMHAARRGFVVENRIMLLLQRSAQPKF
jgi:hypothetical protein